MSNDRFVASLLARIVVLERHNRSMVEFFDRYRSLAHWVQDDRDTAEAEVEKLKAEIEQMHTQMAGISLAALGCTKDPATPGMYGWSVPYADVLLLRQRYDVLLALARAL